MFSQAVFFQQFPPQAEYHNYVYEMIHSKQNNPRFSQLTQYFSTLEKVRQNIVFWSSSLATPR